MPTLTNDQRHLYDEQGYVLVSGLIPADTIRGAAAAMWDSIGADPADPATWSAVSAAHTRYDDAALCACYTPAFLEAAAELAGDPVETITAPTRALTINVFPGAGPWHWPSPHLDHSIREHGHKTFPRAFRVATMTFLSDVSPHGAGTVVWPGSHRKVLALAQSDPAKYETMWALNQDLGLAGIGEPVETTPRAGDVLFYHYLCAHAGSQNTSDRPRFALNAKW
jgi:hypothetical protein